MESERRVISRRTYAPNSYRVLLNTADLAALDGDRAALSRDLSESLRKYARGHGYVLLARPTLELESSAAVQQGDIRVYAQPIVFPATTERQTGLPSKPPAADTAERLAAQDGVDPDTAGLGQMTSVFAAPQVSAPRAQLAVRTPGRSVERYMVRPGTVRVGRSLDNDIVLVDDKVSRHHGQIGVRLGMLVYTDLGSTNGSRLNGSAVTEIALGPGDVLQLGSSTVTIEPAT